MRERYTNDAYEACNFMANYGFHCGKDVGCRARTLKRGNILSKMEPDKKVEMRSQIEQLAAQSGCPNFPLKP